jgi:hypothetical protein
MSFSIYINSNNAITAGAMNLLDYNFDFRNTPEHKGGYKVYMTFASEQQTYGTGSINFGRVNINLGVLDNYTPVAASTATRNNQVFGFIRGSVPQFAAINTIPSYTETSTTPVPVNSGTLAHTLTTTNVVPTYVMNLTAVQTIDARYSENPPTYLQSKPTNNQFTVKITFHDGTAYTALTAHYGMLLTFEAQ